MKGTIDLNGASDPVRMGGIFSITNCIEKAYPDACAKATKPKVRGSASATITLTVVQETTTPGAKCATATASPGQGAGTQKITWQQHHAVRSVYIPDFDLSEAPGCGTKVDVTVTVKAGKGNALALEAGTKVKATSVLYAIPGDTVPTAV
jgi:hypothetical protein